jgi:ABC-2 type transport system permease protein
VSARRTLAVSRRLLAGFRRDRRTLALLFVVPLVILALLGYLMRGTASEARIGVVGAGELAAALESSRQVQASPMTAPEAAGKLRSGEIAGYVVLGAGLPTIYLEGSQPSLNGAVIAAVAGAAPGPRPVLRYLYGGPSLDALDYFGAGFIGLVVFFLVYVVTSVAFLRERSSGTLERLMATPLRRIEIVLGYMVAFTAVALVQSAFVLVFSLYLLRIHNAGNVGLIFLFEALLALAAVNTGIFLSGFARTEFQAVQFIPLVVLPQVLLSGIVFPVLTEPGPLQGLSNVLPLTYDVYGLRDVMVKGFGLEHGALQLDLAVVGAFAVLMLLAAGATLRRRIA